MKITLLVRGWFFGFILISCNGDQSSLKNSTFQNAPVVEKKSTTGTVPKEVNNTVPKPFPEEVINTATRPVPKAVASTVDYSIDDIMIRGAGALTDRTIHSYLGELYDDHDYESIPHIEITRGDKNNRFAFSLTRESVKKYFPDFLFDQLYLYDDSGFLTDITDFVNYEIELLGYQPTIYLVFRVSEEMEMYLKDRDDLLISTIKIDGPLYDISFVSTEKVDYEFGKSVTKIPIDKKYAKWFEISNGVTRYISFNPNINFYESPQEYHLYEITQGKSERLIYERDDDLILGHLKFTNLKLNGKPVLEATLAGFEGHSESTWFIYYNGSRYVYSSTKFR